MLRDIRYAFRILRKNPAFAATAILAMACGIGACTAVFTLVYTLLLRPLAVPRADDLVSIYALSKSKAALSAVSMPDYRDLAPRTDTFEAVGAYFRYPVLLAVGDESERANAELSSGNYHDMLGVRAALGRMLRPDDDHPGATAVVVLSDRLWRRRYGASPDVIGRSLRLNGAAFEIVGVAPPSFVGVLLDWYAAPDTWVPLSQLRTISKQFGRSTFATRRDLGWLQLTARLRPGVRVEAAAAVLQIQAEHTREQNAALYRRLLARVREMPGVEAAAFAANVLPTPMLTEHGVAPSDADDPAPPASSRGSSSDGRRP
jgi:putative ABC transport system permease protein